jgi:uncharacterized protein (DUF2336 family)
MTDGAKTFLQELEEAVSRGSPDSCLRALWHATDLLIAGRYSEVEIWTFGEVIGRLAEEIELESRCRLAKRLASSSNAPIGVVNKLAFDDSIDVAGPVLRRSERLDVKTLVATARTKSQQHLLAISTRRSIGKDVTDVLVARGDQKVLRSVAANDGASFSEFGFFHLVKRSEGDSILVEHIGLRRDIPRHLFQQLIAKASDEVKRKLETERPDMEREIQTVVADVTGILHSKFGPASRNYFDAKRTVEKLHRYGYLNEAKISEYAQSLKFDETAVALSLLCGVSIDAVEQALIDPNREMILVLARGLDLSWSTTMALLFLGATGHRITSQRLDELKSDFARLNVETSRKVLRIYRSRKENRECASKLHRLPQLHSS